MGMARRFQHLLAERHFELLPLQTAWVKARLHLPEAQLLSEMRLLRPDGKFFGGADAVLEISRHFWWAWLPGQIGRIPPVRGILHALYRWVARNRDCINGHCEIKKQKRLVDFLPLLVLPGLALILRTQMAAWVFMWGMAFALYFGCKWLTYREALRRGLRPGLFRTLAYLVAWPGMDAEGFLNEKNKYVGLFGNSNGSPSPRPSPAGRGRIIRRRLEMLCNGFGLDVQCATQEPAKLKPYKTEWIFAATKMIFGAALVWGCVRILVPVQPILAGWVGMAGVVFILHFGCFHLLSLIWRRAGIRATPLMQNPVASRSLAEFWGRRWNTAYHELAFRFTFRPFRRLTTPMAATLSVFGISGLIHELVISLPARGGYGLPTLYFLIQGIGSIFERSRLGCGIGLGQGARGWFFTFVVTVFPAYWLFHPPFITHVILPMLTAIGAT